MELKKYFLLLPLVALGLVGCTSETSDNPEQNEPTSGEEPTTEEPVVETVTYTVTWEASEDFTIEELETSYEAGATVLFTVTVADDANEVSEVAWNSTVITADNAGVYSFTMPEENVVITVAIVAKAIPTLDAWFQNFSDPTSMSYSMTTTIRIKYEQLYYSGTGFYYINDPDTQDITTTSTVLVGNSAVYFKDSGTLYSYDSSTGLTAYTYTESTGQWSTQSYGIQYSLLNTSNLGRVYYYLNTYNIQFEATENGVYTLDDEELYYISYGLGYSTYYSYFDITSPTITLAWNNSATINLGLGGSNYVFTPLLDSNTQAGSYDYYYVTEGWFDVEITNVGTTTVDVNEILGNS